MTAQQSAAADWGTNTKTRTETHAHQHRLARFAGMRIFSEGVAMVTPERGERKNSSVIQPEPKTRSLTRAAIRDRKISLSVSWKKKEEG